MPENEKIIERRDYAATFELRIDDQDKRRLRGYAAVFNEIADLYWFDEEILPGAFRDSIQIDDIRALFNHIPSYILGRNKSGTLTLEEDERGLSIVIDPPKTSIGEDVVISVERGDITQMSFAFLAEEEIWINGKSRGKGKNDLRQLKKVSLRDVSAVTYPAYKGTEIKYREEQRSIEKIYENRFSHIVNNIDFYKRYLSQINQ